MTKRTTKICDSIRGCGLLKDLLNDFGRNPRTVDGRENICKECKNLISATARNSSQERNSGGRPYSNKFSFDYGRLPPLWKERLPLVQAKIRKTYADLFDNYKKSEP